MTCQCNFVRTSSMNHHLVNIQELRDTFPDNHLQTEIKTLLQTNITSIYMQYFKALNLIVDKINNGCNYK